jgi:hypothetical protein
MLGTKSRTLDPAARRPRAGFWNSSKGGVGVSSDRASAADVALPLVRERRRLAAELELTAQIRPLRKRASARAWYPRSWRSSSAGVSGPASSELARRAARDALGRQDDREARGAPRGESARDARWAIQALTSRSSGPLGSEEGYKVPEALPAPAPGGQLAGSNADLGSQGHEVALGQDAPALDRIGGFGVRYLEILNKLGQVKVMRRARRLGLLGLVLGRGWSFQGCFAHGEVLAPACGKPIGPHSDVLRFEREANTERRPFASSVLSR